MQQCRPVCPGAFAEVYQLVNQRLDPEPLSERSDQQQARVGDRVVIIEGDD